MNQLKFHQLHRNREKIKNYLEFLDSDESIESLFDINNNLSSDRINIYKNLYKGIGKTSCYQSILPNNNRLFVKMEYANTLGNSHYSRFWLPYLFIAETAGLIIPNKSNIIDVTSGSAGIALALATKYLGFRSTIIVPDILPVSRKLPMRHQHTEIIEVSGYIDKCINKLIELTNKDDYFPANHSEEKADLITKIFRRIASEYYIEYGSPDYAIIGLGNGTTTTAIFNYFVTKKCNTIKISYHPDIKSGQLIFGLYGQDVKLRHIKSAEEMSDHKYFTNNIKLDEIEEYFKFDTEIRNLGPSSKFGIAIAYKLSKEIKDKTFLTIGYDKNDRY